MKRHAALPQFEDLGGMLDEERKIVEQHIAGAATEDDADRDPENEIIHVQQGDRRPTVPQIRALDQGARVHPAQHDAADIAERIPADRDRPDGNGEGIEGRKGDGEKGHQENLTGGSEVIMANCSTSVHVDARAGPTRSSMSLPPEPTRFRCIYDPSMESNSDNRAGETSTVSLWPEQS